jgi:hypothetical protein
MLLAAGCCRLVGAPLGSAVMTAVGRAADVADYALGYIKRIAAPAVLRAADRLAADRLAADRRAWVLPDEVLQRSRAAAAKWQARLGW